MGQSSRGTVVAKRPSPRYTNPKTSKAAPTSNLPRFASLVDQGTELIMRRIALVMAFTIGLIAPASAQKAEIDAVNAKWTEFFNTGDFAGVASLYTTDATAFPPGSAMVHGGSAIGAMWKSMAEQVSDPKLVTMDVKPLGPSAAREIG